MKKTLLFSLLVPVLMPGLTTMSYAGDKPNEIHIEKHATTNPELEGMSREERRDYWQKKREERLANMTPEQRQAWEEKRRARREKWESMSPEEREEIRKHWQHKFDEAPAGGSENRK